MDGLTAVLVAAAAAAGSMVTHFFEAWIDRRNEFRSVGRLDVLRKRFVAQFDAVTRLQGMLANLDHYVTHCISGDWHYIARGTKVVEEIRRFARDNVGLLGEPMLTAVKAETDAASVFFEERDTSAMWEDARFARMTVMSNLLRKIDTGH